MINYETILSAFDDKETLLKWLKKVEKALAESTLTTVDCVNVDESHIKFTFSFADGTKIETPQVYVKPGVDGTNGKDGIGFDTLSEVTIPSAVSSLTYSGAKGAIVSGNAVFKTADGDFTVAAKNIIPIFGKGDVTLAKDDTGKKLLVSLAGYDAATTGYYPRKSASGLEWVAGTGGGGGSDIPYETGTITAQFNTFTSFTGQGGTGAAVGNTFALNYTKIGNIVNIYGVVNSGNFTTDGSNLAIGIKFDNFSFTPAHSGENTMAGSVGLTGQFSAYMQYMYISNNSYIMCVTSPYFIAADPAQGNVKRYEAGQKNFNGYVNFSLAVQ